MATDLSLLFKTTVELYTFQPIPAGSNGLPAGCRISMPMGGQHVITDLFTLDPGIRGVYRLRVTERMPQDAWEQSALRLLENLLAVLVTAHSPTTEMEAEGITNMFHPMWTTGAEDIDLLHIGAAYDIVADASGMRWVTDRERAQGSR